jgi:hypothetical protein
MLPLAPNERAAGLAPSRGYCPRCPDFDDVDCGLGRGGGSPPGFDFAGGDGPAAPASFGREDWREKSGIPRGDFFFFMEPPECDASGVERYLTPESSRVAVVASASAASFRSGHVGVDGSLGSWPATPAWRATALTARDLVRHVACGEPAAVCKHVQWVGPSGEGAVRPVALTDFRERTGGEQTEGSDLRRAADCPSNERRPAARRVQATGHEVEPGGDDQVGGMIRQEPPTHSKHVERRRPEKRDEERVVSSPPDVCVQPRHSTRSLSGPPSAQGEQRRAGAAARTGGRLRSRTDAKAKPGA